MKNHNHINNTRVCTGPIDIYYLNIITKILFVLFGHFIKNIIFRYLLKTF